MGSLWVPVILNGPGRVGTKFVHLLWDKAPYIEARTGIRPVLVAVVDADRSLFSPDGLTPEDIDRWKRDDGQASGPSFPDILDTMADVGPVPYLPGIVVEATPTDLATGEPGLGHITRALWRGFSVITLAKGPLVVAFQQLRALAADTGASLRYSGAAAAALPTVDTALYSMAGADIVEIEGVLNGTTNYVLNSMAQGMDYDEALTEAQEMGVAEADPTLDVQGFDSAAKLLILANTIWGVDLCLRDVTRQGITQIQKETVVRHARKGTPVRLLARATRDDREGGAIQMTVRPEPVPAGHPFVNLPGTQKAVRYLSRQMGEITIMGGAGDVAGAAAAALKDLIHILDEMKLRIGI